MRRIWIVKLIARKHQGLICALTFSNSSGVKMNLSDILSGTMRTTKKGKKRAMGEDLIAHKRPRPHAWIIVYRWSFHVLTCYKRNVKTFGVLVIKSKMGCFFQSNPN